MDESTTSVENADPPQWRLTLRDLLFATAIVAAAVAPMRWMGGMYTASAFFSLVLLAALAWLLVWRKSILALVPCGLAVLISAPLFSSGLFFQAVLSLLVYVSSLRFADRVRWRIAACAAVMFVAYVPAFREAIRRDREITHLREEWPIVSIRDRLPINAGDNEGLLVPVSLTKEQIETLQAYDTQPSDWGSLPFLLEQVHSDTYRRFARAPGFGFYRMGPVTADRLARADTRSPAGMVDLPVSLNARMNDRQPDGIHTDFRHGFLHSDRLGYVESVERVTGFVGHGFEDSSYLVRQYEEAKQLPAITEESLGNPSRWHLTRLNLIGLLLHAEPTAYVSDELPDMEKLRTAPTRPLDDFETGAIERLRGQEDLVVDDATPNGHVRMVGAIRAGESCQVCHQVGHGVLLGAFSYHLEDRVVVTKLD